MGDQTAVGAIAVLSREIRPRLNERKEEHRRLAIVLSEQSKFKILNERPATGNGVGKVYFDAEVLEGRLRGQRISACKEFTIIVSSAGQKEDPVQDAKAALQLS